MADTPQNLLVRYTLKMSSKKEEEFTQITKQEYTTQITPNDVMGTLKANCLIREYQSLRKTNIKTMKNWIFLDQIKWKHFNHS